MRDFWKVTVCGFTEELQTQSFGMTCSTSSHPREWVPTDKCIMWTTYAKKNLLQFCKIWLFLIAQNIVTAEPKTFLATYVSFVLQNCRVCPFRFTVSCMVSLPRGRLSVTLILWLVTLAINVTIIQVANLFKISLPLQAGNSEREWFYILILILKKKKKKKIMSRCFSAAAGFFHTNTRRQRRAHKHTHTHTSAEAEILLRPFEV